MTLVRVDIGTIDDYRLALIPLVAQATAALTGLTEVAPPALGGFQDAVETTEHHQALRAGFLDRLRQVAFDLVAMYDSGETARAAYEEAAREAPERISAVAKTMPAPIGTASAAQAPAPAIRVVSR